MFEERERESGERVGRDGETKGGGDVSKVRNMMQYDGRENDQRGRSLVPADAMQEGCRLPSGQGAEVLGTCSVEGTFEQ